MYCDANLSLTIVNINANIWLKHEFRVSKQNVKHKYQSEYGLTEFITLPFRTSSVRAPSLRRGNAQLSKKVHL